MNEETYRLKSDLSQSTRPEGGVSPPGEGTASETEASPPQRKAPRRLVSLDAYRGFIMITLAASGFGVARFAALPEDAPVWSRPVIEQGKVRDATPEEIAARRAWWKDFAFHFSHPTWRSDFLTFPAENPAEVSQWKRLGVSFWDLIQPAFMFMVGVAMPFSYDRRRALGQLTLGRFGHAFARAVILILLGVFLYSLRSDRTNWIFTNVLAQIGLGYFFVYLMLGLRWWVQVIAIALILVGTWWFMQFGYWQLTGQQTPNGTYDYAAVQVDPERGEVLTGRFAPWSKNDNAFHAVDEILLNKLRDPEGKAMAAWREKMAAGELTRQEWWQMTVRRCLFSNPETLDPARHGYYRGGYKTLNFVPSIATMLLGVLFGRLLLSDRSRFGKLTVILLSGILCLVLGRIAGMYACPIVKKIWTPSWVLFSGGYVIGMLGLFYLLFDILPLRWLGWPLAIVGMNSIVMYLLGQLMRSFTLSQMVRTHLSGVIETILGTDPMLDGEMYLWHEQMFGRLIDPIAVLAVFWLIAFWLWRRKLFVRI